MKFTKQQAEKTLNRAKSKTEWAKLLGFRYLNGRVSKQLNELIRLYGLDISHFDTHHKKRKYKIVQKNCPICNKRFSTREGHPREKTVCSHSCSNTYFANIRHTRDANEKTRQSMLQYAKASGKRIRKQLNCARCHKSFWPIKTSQIYCSKKCGALGRTISDETREKLRQVQLKLIDEGRHTGWQSRSKCKKSYAEEYVTKILQKNGIIEGQDYEFEFRQNKWFIDFAFVKNKIAIEIDGKQHNYPDRKAKDKEKDSWLIANGWIVYRIQWNRPTLETRKHLLNQLNQILSFKIEDDTVQHKRS